MDANIQGLLREARTQLEAERARRSEPIAIVGIGCRMPGGATSPERFWDLLESGVDATSAVPWERWGASLFDADPEAPGKIYVERGAFLDAIDAFDPDPFGISPREAAAMDPQQRLLLEVAWEALEDAGIPPRSARGSATGVWVGLCLEDYARTISADPRRIDAYSALGNARSVAAGRISYVLDLSGPSVQLDTACSSSLVALHQACQSLRLGECERALVGGVNVMAGPESTIALCKLRALAKDGRSKSFDASADGYGRGEGCGVLVLERLSEARARGRRIYAVVRGSAVNHDGRSNGLTAPSGAAQEALVRAALHNAGLEASAIDFVEAHGTGTPLGDPIEVLALGRVYSEQRSTQAPLYLGSVKSNLGHLEGAAGVASLIKVALCLTHARIPPNLHFRAPNPKIPWERLPLRVPTESVPWPRSGSPRRAAVSSFGLSGTNAHVVLEAAPTAEPRAKDRAADEPRTRAARAAAETRSAELIVLSAKTPSALIASAARLCERLEQRPPELAELARGLLTTRSLLEARLALVAPSLAALRDALARFARGELPEGAAHGQASARGGAAWLFPGQGAQRLGAGRVLYRQWPAFREAFDAACAEVDRHLPLPVREVLWAEPDTDAARRLDRTELTQPALFVLQWALAALYRSFGVEPSVVGGHSVGEIAAAAVAGVFSLPDAARWVCARARISAALPAGGAMAAIATAEEEVRAALAPYAGRVAIAAFNGPREHVISGDEGDVLALVEAFVARGARARLLRVSHAFHSPRVDPALPELSAVADGLRLSPPTLPLVSALTGTLVGDEVTRPEHWVQHLRSPVRFGDALRAMQRKGARAFLELGAGSLLGLVPAALATDDLDLLAALPARGDETRAVLSTLASWIARGGDLDARGLFPRAGGHVALPTYPWQRRRFWFAPTSGALSGASGAHPFLGARLPAACADAIYETVIGVSSPAWLADHVVAGATLLPGSAFVELIAAAGTEALEAPGVAVDELVLLAPCVLPADDALRLQVVVDPATGQAAVHAQPRAAAAAAPWTLHARARVEKHTATPTPIELSALRERCGEPVDLAALRAALAEVGLAHGPKLQALRTLAVGGAEALGEIELDAEVDARGHLLHPVVLDAAIQAVAALLEPGDDPLLPFALGRIVIHQRGATRVLVHARCAERKRDAAVADLTLLDAGGQVVAEVTGLALRRAPLARVAALAPLAAPTFHTIEWLPSTAPPSRGSGGRFRVLAEFADAPARALAAALRQRGAECALTSFAELDELAAAQHVVCLWRPSAEPEATALALEQAQQLVQRLARHERPPRLWWLTRGAVAVSRGEDVAPAAGALWGFGRSVMLEHPELWCTLVDVEPRAPLADVLGRELAASDREDQVAWRSGKRHVARLVRAAPHARLPQGDFQLTCLRRGTLDTLTPLPAARRAPGPGEVEIETRALGLNFRDVLGALGAYPGDPGPLGSECAGVVSAIGAGVTAFAAGDRVMALAPGAFRRFVTADARLVATIPESLSFEQAATIPVAFLTAWYALHDLARLKAGERLLVHAAAGGVGMAALQLAKLAGAEVVATAHPSKWPTLEALGVRALASSRSPEFADAIRRAVGSVDVVLNSLTRELIDRGLSLLAPGGRFIELGKIDLRDPRAVAATHPGVSYRAFDLAEAGPERIAQMFQCVGRHFAAGELAPLPLSSFPVTRAEAAFRQMAQARHIGKIVLVPRAQLAEPGAGTVLVTGGLGALGRRVARHLAQRGFRHLLLLGRRGLETPGADEIVEELRALGASVSVVAADVACADSLSRALSTLPVERPLSGVVHAAGQLDDGLLVEQTPERLRRVLAPKALGAWNLHAATRAQRLDFFVIFSSLAASVGSPGQAAYAAANAFVDALASHRRAHGLPATSIGYGPWSGAGMAAQLEARLRGRLERRGVRSLSVAEALARFDAALERPEPHLIAATLDLPTLARDFGASAPPLWRSLIEMPSPATASSFSSELSKLASSERLAAVSTMVRHEIARVLSLPSADHVALDRPLADLGLDSLMAMELRNALSRRAGAPLSLMAAFEHPTPAALARHLLDHVLADGTRDPLD